MDPLRRYLNVVFKDIKSSLNIYVENLYLFYPK